MQVPAPNVLPPRTRFPNYPRPTHANVYLRSVLRRASTGLIMALSHPYFGRNSLPKIFNKRSHCSAPFLPHSCHLAPSITHKTLSTAGSITSGVPQGSVLGPLLFLVHFRDIPEALSPSQTSLFADDTMAFQDNCSGEQTSPCCDLSKHPENLSCWAASNNVDFNIAKSADLGVGSKPPPSACLFMNGTAIRRVQRHVHLICAETTMLPLYWRKLRLHYTCLLPSPIVISYLQQAQLKVARAIVHSQHGQPGPEVLSECHLPTLAWRRRAHCLCLLYILYKGQGPPSLSELLPSTVQAGTEIVLRSSHSFRFPFASSSRHLSSFLCFSIRLWNTLPASAISQSRSVSSFRSFLRSFYKADKFSLGL